jgi:hypothetical protein
MLLQHIIDSGIYDEVHVEVSQHALPDVHQEPRGVKAPTYVFRTAPSIVDGNKIYIETR